jgi:hypothetical protein
MKSIASVLLCVFFLFACKSKTYHPGNNDQKAPERMQAVCISTGTPLREEPRKEGKWISSMILGEKLTYLGETKADSANPQQEYYRVELSDGKLAWARSYGIIVNATPAAVIAKTPICKRPDLLTKTDKWFQVVEFVVVVSEKDDWVEVVGAEKRKNGWIKKSTISINADDVAVSTLAQKDLLNKNGEIINDKLSVFIESLPEANSQLARYLQDQMTNQVESAIEQSIQDYEGQEDDEEIVIQPESTR